MLLIVTDVFCSSTVETQEALAYPNLFTLAVVQWSFKIALPIVPPTRAFGRTDQETSIVSEKDDNLSCHLVDPYGCARCFVLKEIRIDDLRLHPPKHWLTSINPYGPVCDWWPWVLWFVEPEQEMSNSTLAMTLKRQEKETSFNT
jgi:hypothetical protein